MFLGQLDLFTEIRPRFAERVDFTLLILTGLSPPGPKTRSQFVEILLRLSSAFLESAVGATLIRNEIVLSAMSFYLVRTITEHTQCLIAVVAKKTVIVFGKVILFQPLIEILTAGNQFLPVLSAATINVIDREKFRPLFLAACAFSAVGGYHEQLQFLTPFLGGVSIFLFIGAVIFGVILCHGVSVLLSVFGVPRRQFSLILLEVFRCVSLVAECRGIVLLTKRTNHPAGFPRTLAM